MKALFRLLSLAVLLGVCAAVPAAAARPPFLLAATRATFTPGTPVRLDIATQTAADVEVAAFALTVDDAAGIALREPALRVAESVFVGRSAVRTARAHVEPDAAAQNVSVGALPAGFYALRVRGNGELVGTVLVSVTTIGITTSDAGNRFIAFAVDLKSFHARDDVTFERLRVVGANVETVRAGTGGIASFERPDVSETDVVVARGVDGSTAVARAAASFQRGVSHAGYVQTDRPIYRPGDRVRYRAILREGDPGALTAPSGERTVLLRDARSKEIARATRTLDAFGTLQGEFALAGDAELGGYDIIVGPVDDRPAVTSLAVEAYKKPEYLIDVAPPPLTVSGDPIRVGVAARYFFGRPAAGMKLHYRGYFRPSYRWWRGGTPFRFAGYFPPDWNADNPPEFEGDATADAAGRATLAIPTADVTTEKELTLEIDGRDESGRTVTAQTRAQIVPASFYLSVAPGSYFVKAGNTVNLAVRSLAYAANEARPRTPVEVRFERITWNGRESVREPQSADAASIVTDDTGSAIVRWKPTATGYYEIVAKSRDERNRSVSTIATMWVVSERYDRQYAFDRIALTPQKAEYGPGEKALLLVTAPYRDVDALVRVIGGARDRVSVTRLTSETSTIEVEPPAGVARYRVTVTAPGRGGVQSASAILNVVPAPHRLRVAIRPGKARYAPGERARFALHVEDGDGKPVRAQVGVAVVDDAIFALRQARQGDPFDVFYGSAGPNRNENATWTSVDTAIGTYREYPLMTIGRTVTRASASLAAPEPVPPPPAPAVAGAAQPSFEQLRNDFRDTAFWSPSVVTAADGNAVVAFDWPDSLTSYTASGLAVTQGSDIGAGSGSVLVTKDFLVRLSAPRFLRRGDAARITAIAQGVPPAKSARLRFSAPMLGVADDTTTARFDARAVASAQWDVRGGELGTSSLRLAGTSGALSDGMRITLPVETSGTAQHERAAGMLPQSASVALKLPAGAEAGDLRIDLAPSALAQLVAGMRLLQVYPYYCVEQTMSAALPAVYVDRMRKRIKLPPPEGPAPADVAKRAVDRLAKLQHADGSWGWWEHDAANPFMSAYALYGLAELAREGYAVPPDVLARGVRSVDAQMRGPVNTLAYWGGSQPNSDWNTRAFMLFALANAQPGAVDRDLLAKADAHAKDVNAYALAVLGLAHVELNDRAGAQPLLAELLRRVTDQDGYAHWKGEGWHYRWQDDPIETTAYALRFVHAMTPNDPRVVRTVNWLRTQQHGSWFATTKDTAAAIYAMTEAVPVSSNELDPHETVRVTVDGRVVKAVRIDAPVLSRADASIVVPARMLRGGALVRFEREGTGALSWSTDWTQYLHDAAPAVANDPDLRVQRTYTMRGGNDWRVGDTVDVDLTVTAKTDTQYVAVEDPLPAGLEYQPKQYASGDNWSGLQFFDDRVVFFTSRLSSYNPLHLRYTLRATTAGAFTAPAPTAYAMYGPPVTATGRPAKVTIR
ncbi:MAG: alpha-2-macroglobulin [Candidatus Eremiobacteraeota bacterium]|nr:alpha-2-macroglobulin [Candidatus Eremiobacteraeota bacterium]